MNTFKLEGYDVTFLFDKQTRPDITTCVLKNQKTRKSTAATVIRHYMDKCSKIAAKKFAFDKVKSLLNSK